MKLPGVMHSLGVSAVLGLAELIGSKLGHWNVQCPVCGWRFRSFRPAGYVARPNARCARCGSLERHRLLWLYLREHTQVFSEPVRILHFAPEPCVSRRLSALRHVHYVSADVVSGSVAVTLDIERIPFEPESFDLILCSHVLEHVTDDGAALKEVYRVLRTGGLALVQIPVDETRSTTFEDPTATDAADRARLFGQSDHVRIYGRDCVERLQGAGFAVDRYSHREVQDANAEALYALHPEPIHVCRKARVDK